MLEALGNHVILEIIQQSDELKNRLKKSGLLVQDDIKQGEPDRGRVYAIGPDVKEPGFKVGDVVVFHTKEVFQGFKHDGKNLVSMNDFEIMAVLTGEVA